jgi:hypothetical protein
MPTDFNKEFDTIIQFGGGIHSRASEEDIDPRECSIGKNFDLDPQNREFRNRKPFDLIGTVPNGAEIRGFVNLLKTDGTISLLVQAGSAVYEWDGVTTFTNIGSVSATAKLRGRLEHNWQLDDKVIITDLNLIDPVKEWDGTTLQNISFTDETGSAFGTFRARYCTVRNERAIFSNIHDNGTDFPHLLVGSQTSDYTTISVAQRPSSAISTSDPFFLIQPDFRYINGMIEAFGIIATSSKRGTMFKLTGSDATHFAFRELYPRSGASGDESLAYVGNDIAFGRAGVIESLISTDKFGDVDTNDISNGIFDLIETFDDWTIVYNSRNQRIYCLAAGRKQIWVYHKSVAGLDISPWSKWTTAHSSDFDVTAIMNMLDPSDGLEYVFFGDVNGNFYRMEGTGVNGDAGLNNITSERLSPLIKAPLNAQTYNGEGWIAYRAGNAQTVTLTFEYRGENIFNESITITIPAVANRKVYGGGHYYSNSEGYGSFSGRLTRQPYAVAGGGNEFQVRVTVEGTEDFRIKEIGLRFGAAT